jgi:hypothetical protein
VHVLPQGGQGEPRLSGVTGETLTTRQLNRATLARQMLLTREHVGAAEAVGLLAGLQAQEAKPPFLGLAGRLSTFEPADLSGALHRREVVRGLLMRGTLHLVTAADYLAFRPALQPVMEQAVRVLGTRAKGLEIEPLLATARSLFAAAPRTFGELRSLLTEAFPGVDERALGYTVRTHLPLVMVPTADRWAFPADSRFTLADDWLGGPVAPSSDAGELALAYLRAFGPASAADLHAWSGLRSVQGAAALDALRPQLLTFTDERGRELFDVPSAPRPPADVPAPPRLLPEFDNLLLAHADRSRIVADADRARVVTKNLRVRATLLWDGFVRGTWEIKRRGKAATVIVTPFEGLPAGVVAECEGEAQALLRVAEPEATSYQLVIAGG